MQPGGDRFPRVSHTTGQDGGRPCIGSPAAPGRAEGSCPGDCAEKWCPGGAELRGSAGRGRARPPLGRTSVPRWNSSTACHPVQMSTSSRLQRPVDIPTGGMSSAVPTKWPLVTSLPTPLSTPTQVTPLPPSAACRAAGTQDPGPGTGLQYRNAALPPEVPPPPGSPGPRPRLRSNPLQGTPAPPPPSTPLPWPLPSVPSPALSPGTAPLPPASLLGRLWPSSPASLRPLTPGEAGPLPLPLTATQPIWPRPQGAGHFGWETPGHPVSSARGSGWQAPGWA